MSLLLSDTLDCAKMGQVTALPAASNRIVVTMSTNVPLRSGTCLRLKGFNDGVPSEPSSRREVLLASTGSEKWEMVAPVQGGSELGFGLWDGDVLEVCLVDVTEALTEYVFAIGVMNPAQAQEPKTISIESTKGVNIAAVQLNVDSGDKGIREPFRILLMQFLNKAIGASTRFPGASNTITITLGLLLPLEPQMQPEFTVSGLSGSRTAAAPALAIGCAKDCVRDCASVAPAAGASPGYACMSMLLF